MQEKIMTLMYEALMKISETPEYPTIVSVVDGSSKLSEIPGTNCTTARETLKEIEELLSDVE